MCPRLPLWSVTPIEGFQSVVVGVTVMLLFVVLVVVVDVDGACIGLTDSGTTCISVSNPGYELLKT